jgi:hypothetical protein
MVEAFTILLQTEATPALAARFGWRYRRWDSWIGFELECSWVAFQNAFPGFFDVISVKGSIVTRLALALRTARSAGRKALTIKLQAF